MEPGIKEFFRRLVATISLLVLWMMINLTVGIKYDCAFIEDKVRWYNIVFYCWFLISLVTLIWVCIKIWQKPIENLND